MSRKARSRLSDEQSEKRVRANPRSKPPETPRRISNPDPAFSPGLGRSRKRVGYKMDEVITYIADNPGCYEVPFAPDKLLKKCLDSGLIVRRSGGLFVVS